MSNRIVKNKHKSELKQTLDLNDKNPTISSHGGTLMAGVSLHNTKMRRSVPKQIVSAKTITPEVIRTIQQMNTTGGRFSLFQKHGGSIRFA